MTTATEELVSNILETKFEKFSSEAIGNVKKRFIDIVGCTIGGANASGNSILLDLIRGWGGKDEATILVHGNRVPLHNAAMMNSIMCRSFDYEVCGPLAEGEVKGRFTSHICGTTEPTALSVAEYKDSSGKDLIAAATLGGDLAVRVAIAEDFDEMQSFELTGTVTAFGATAVAGRLLGLNESQMLNALGIVVDQLAGSYQHIIDGVQSFKINQGLAARNAIISVELASKGFTGIKDPLLSPRGYYAQYCKSYQPELLTKELGETFYTRGCHKMRPSCFGNHAAIECCLKILSQNNINAEDVAEVTLTAPSSAFRSLNIINQPFEIGASQARALFSLSYGIATALVRKGTKLEHYTEEFTHDPKVIELTRKVKLESGTQVKSGTSDPPIVAGVNLTIKMKDGQQFSANVEAPRGTLLSPLTMDEVKDKFWANVDFSKTVSRKNAGEALILLENLEEVSKISEIIKLLVA